MALIAQTTHLQSKQDIIGTTTYMAPEQIRGQVRQNSDQYALGVAVYEWLSGDYLFRGSFSEVCAQHMFATPEPLRAKVPDLSPEIEQVVLTALAKDPAQRFANVRAFAHALEQACSPESSFAPPPSPSSYQASPSLLSHGESYHTEPFSTSQSKFNSAENSPDASPSSSPSVISQGPSSLSPQPGPIMTQGITAPTDKPPLLAQELSSLPTVEQDNLVEAQSQARSSTGLSGLMTTPLWQSIETRLPLRMRSPMSVMTLLAILALVVVLGGSGLLYAATRHPNNQPSITVISRKGGTPTGVPQDVATPKQQTSPVVPATPTQQTTPIVPATPTPSPTPEPPPTPTPSPFPTDPQSVYTVATSGNPALSSSLSHQDANNWSEINFAGGGGCGFSGGAYHATMPHSGFVAICPAQTSNFSNFAFQVTMTTLSGANADGGGLLFRSNANSFYRLRIGVDGSFDLAGASNALNSNSSAIKTGVNQTNVVTVVAYGQRIYFYVNGRSIATIKDGSSASGQIGVFAVGWTKPTDVAFSNAIVWQL